MQTETKLPYLPPRLMHRLEHCSAEVQGLLSAPDRWEQPPLSLPRGTAHSRLEEGTVTKSSGPGLLEDFMALMPRYVATAAASICKKKNDEW